MRNLSDYQHLKYDTFATQEKVFDPTDAIKEVVKTHSIESSINNISIKYNTDERDRPVEVITDAERIIQVLQNVVRQTVRLSKYQTQIEIDCWTEIREIEGVLFFSVTFVGDKVTEDQKKVMFSEIGDEG